MPASLTIGSSAVATAELSTVPGRPAPFRLRVRHRCPAAEDVLADLGDAAVAFGEEIGGRSRVRLTLIFGNGQSADNGPDPTGLRLEGGEGRSHRSDRSPVATAERVFRLLPSPQSGLVGVRFRWPALGIPETHTAWR